MFERVSGPIWMVNVKCAGYESDVGSCSHNGWGNTAYCGTGSDIGVICFTRANILSNKPAVQSSTDSGLSPTSANDDSWINGASRTESSRNSYWQGDLVEFYMVDSITVASVYGDQLRNAKVIVSDNDAKCPVRKMVECGQWPNNILSQSWIKFNCTLTDPVRYVTIQMEGDNVQLGLREVYVEGTPIEGTPSSISSSGTFYERHSSMKVTTPTLSLTVARLTGCAVMCNMKQPCKIFSYSPTQQPNCHLATDVAMETDPEWKSGIVKTC